MKLHSKYILASIRICRPRRILYISLALLLLLVLIIKPCHLPYVVKSDNAKQSIVTLTTNSSITSTRFINTTCTEKTHLVFLKTHKTGSSTIANILQRFGLSRRLNFALPRKRPGQVRYNYFGGIGETLRKDDILSSQRNQSVYNILYNHVIFNISAFEYVFQPPTKYITILRNPLTQFRSAILYFIHHEAIYNAALKNISSYLENPSAYEPKETYISFTDNRQALDLGVPPKYVRNAGFLDKYTHTLDKKFDLVLIMEYFDESLVLLKRLMCWSIKDILYVRKNMGYRNVSFSLSAHDIQHHRQWALADHKLYDFFITKLRTELNAHADIKDEIKYFKKVLIRTQQFCDNSAKSMIAVHASRWNSKFSVTSLDCAYMKLGELEFLNKLLKGSEYINH